MCKYNKLWCDGKAALLRKNQCDQCYRDAVLALSQGMVTSISGQYNAIISHRWLGNMGVSSAKEPGEQLYHMLGEEYAKIRHGSRMMEWERCTSDAHKAWAALEARVGLGDKVVTTGSSLAEQILALSYKEQHEIYKLLYAVNHRI